jgi:hypothetical protein
MGRNAGGSETVKTEIPKWLEGAAKDMLGQAQGVAQIGPVRYGGPDVAALTPQQIAARQGTNQAASAFGMGTVDPTAGLPQAQDFGGMQGYSSAPIYDQALEELRRTSPAQYEAIMGQFINPKTGAAPVGMPSAAVPTPKPKPKPAKKSKSSGRSNALAAGRRAAATSGQGGDGGKVGAFVRDMLDGGGRGKSGDKFEGGIVSKILNVAGVKPLPAKKAPVAAKPVARPARVSRANTVSSSPVPRPRPIRTAPIGKGR